MTPVNPSPTQRTLQEKTVNILLNQVEVDDVAQAQKRRIVKMLLQGATYGLPGSDGTIWSNFREWAKNQHPVLSVFFAHELHPFSRTERFCVLLCYLCWAFLITCIFEQMNRDNRETCDEGCERTYFDRSTLTEMCESNPVTPDEYDRACNAVMPWYLLSFTIAACTVPYSTILKILATCGCVQAMPNLIKRCIEFLGTMVLGCFGCLSFVWLGLGISISLTLDGGMFMMVYMAGVAKSWMYWPFLAGVVFLWKFKKAKRRFGEEHPGQVAMAWPVVQPDTDLEIKMGGDGKPVAYVSPPASPRNSDGTKASTSAAIIAHSGSPRMTPEPTPCPPRLEESEVYPAREEQQNQHHNRHQQQQPSHSYSAVPERPPPENPYLSNHLGGVVHGEREVPPSYPCYQPSPTEYQCRGGTAIGTYGRPSAMTVGASDGGGGGRRGPEVQPCVYESRNSAEAATQATHWEIPGLPRQPPPPPSYEEHQAAHGRRSRPPSPPPYQRHQDIYNRQPHYHEPHHN